MSRTYLDHAATTRLRAEARAAMEEGFAIWANPSSPHAEGRKARAALEEARERCKAALGWDAELIFTSGASESIRICAERARRDSVWTSPVEHDAVQDVVMDAHRLMLDAHGQVDLDRSDLAQASSPLVFAQSVNSETGNRFDLSAIASSVHEADGVLAVDASQSAGKLPLEGDADFVIVSAHKFGGPIGIGALLVRDFQLLSPSGGHERGYRRGTENFPGALGMAAALETHEWSTTKEQREHFIGQFGEAYLRLGKQVDYIVPLTHPTMSAQALLIRLDAMGFAVSAGSACSSGSLKPSRVLKAFGLDDDTASRTIRVSPGWNTTPAELDAFAQAWASL